MSQPVSATDRRSGRSREITAIILTACSLFVVISLYTTAAGVAGFHLARGLRWLLGDGALAIALFLFSAAVGAVRSRIPTHRWRKRSAIGLIFIASLIGYHLIWTSLRGPLSIYWVLQAGETGQAGGMLGAFLASRVLAAFGAWGSAVVLTALCTVGISLMLETPITRYVARLISFIVSLAFGGTKAMGDFFRGVVVELKDLVASTRDRMERKRAEKAAAQAGQVHAAAVGEGGQEAALPQPVEQSAMSPGGSLLGRVGSGLSSLLPAAPSRSKSLSSNGQEVSMQSDVVESAPPGDFASSEGEYASDNTLPASDYIDDGFSLTDVNGPESLPQSDDPKSAGQASSGRRRTHSSGRRSSSTATGQQTGSSVDGTIPLEAPSETPEPVYRLPPTALLTRPKDSGKRRGQGSDDQSALLEETLANFGVKAKVVKVSRGPVITRYELQPAPGIKVSRIVNLADDVALSLAAADVRIEAPVPGKSVVGIEVPNTETSIVYLREVLESQEFQESDSKIVAGLGMDIAGNPVVADLTKLLHVLIAGATGSGKSFCINTIICSILFKALPSEVKLMMIDPKRVELANYDGIPHLITPVVTDPKMAANALRWAVKEMESRYKKFAETGVRNIDGYNRAVAAGTVEDDPIPFLVIIIDELADLMLVAANEVEDSICRLAQMARAAGIHLIIATQRPSVDVITGLIKANVPSRIAFSVSSGVDSRTILDSIGAERLIGKGDMLYYPIGANKPLRAQGSFITDKDVNAVVDFWKRQGTPEYQESVTEAPSSSHSIEESDDELFSDAVQLVVETGNASISMLQRRFRIGYARAARLIDMMELRGIVGPYQGSKPREVLRGIDELEEIISET